MKHLKQYEDMEYVNSSDMENWDPNQFAEKKLLKTKSTEPLVYDKELGEKTIELLKEYNLGILSVGKGDYLTKYNILLEDEKNLIEYRVQLSKYILEDEEGNELEEDQITELDDDCGNMEFSVFFPNSKIDNIEVAAMSQASEYLKELKNSTEAWDDNDNFLSDNPDGFKKFLDYHKIKITNKNVEVVNDINYRLHKDSKFFGNVKDAIDRDYDSLLRDWLNLV